MLVNHIIKVLETADSVCIWRPCAQIYDS